MICKDLNTEKPYSVCESYSPGHCTLVTDLTSSSLGENPNFITNEPKGILSKLKKENYNKFVVAQLNINSIRNKFVELKSLVTGLIDILILTETKIDDTFPTSQFSIDGYSIPYRLDINGHGGGILIYIRNDIPSKLLKNHNIDDKIEGMFVKLNFGNGKWLLFRGYNPHKELSSQFLRALGESLVFYLPHYENTLILGDFNVEEDEGEMSEFCENYNFTNLVNEPTCFKNMNNPSCNDLIIRNRKRYFQHTKVIETGISYHHKMTITMFKSKFKKSKSNIITYRDYKNFDRDLFRKQLSERFSVHDEIQYKCFDEIYINIDMLLSKQNMSEQMMVLS